MIDVVNLQRKVKVELATYRTYINELVAAVPETSDCTFSVAFIADSRMKQLNELFRGKNTSTDVLSFPWSEPPASAGGQLADDDSTNWPPAHAGGSDFLGDIVISAEQAQKQAAENGLTLENEIKQLILHGLLHLLGYDHETDDGEMNALELELREKLGI